MRIYLPALVPDLAAATLSARPAHAVTPALRAAVDDEEEILELIAFLAAADDSVRLIGAADGAPARRIVISADVGAGSVSASTGPDDLETAVMLSADVEWLQVEAIHADEAPAAGLVARAANGDDEVFEQVAELDLLWFDPSERAALQAELTGRPETPEPAGR